MIGGVTVCPSVCLSVRPSVRVIRFVSRLLPVSVCPSVCPSVRVICFVSRITEKLISRFHSNLVL